MQLYNLNAYLDKNVITQHFYRDKNVFGLHFYRVIGIFIKKIYAIIYVFTLKIKFCLIKINPEDVHSSGLSKNTYLCIAAQPTYIRKKSCGRKELICKIYPTF